MALPLESLEPEPAPVGSGPPSSRGSLIECQSLTVNVIEFVRQYYVFHRQPGCLGAAYGRPAASFGHLEGISVGTL